RPPLLSGVDYEAVGLSSQASCFSGIFSARTPLHPGLRGVRAEKMPLHLRRGEVTVGLRVADALGSHATIRAAARAAGACLCAGPAIQVRRAAHWFGHPRVTLNCHGGSTPLRADATGSLGRSLRGSCGRSSSGQAGLGGLRPAPPPPAAATAPCRAAWP